MTDTEHPLRRRLIMRAALDNITPEQRENTIKLACPGWEREHALQMLRQIHEAHKRGTHDLGRGALGFSLWRWSETSSLLERGGIRC